MIGIKNLMNPKISNIVWRNILINLSRVNYIIINKTGVQYIIYIIKIRLKYSLLNKKIVLNII